MGLGGDRIDDSMESSITECRRDTAGIDGAHGVVGTILSITLDCTLHCDTSVENNVDEGGNVEDVRDGGRGGVLSERVTGKSTILLNISLHGLMACGLGWAMAPQK